MNPLSFGLLSSNGFFSASWFNKAMDKVNYWKTKLLDKEKQFQEEIQKLEKSKKELEQSCVAKCDKRKGAWYFSLFFHSYDCGLISVLC